MSRRVPRGGPGPEWPNEPDDGQAYGDQGAQHNGYGPNGYNGPTATTATATGTALPARISSSTASTASTADLGAAAPRATASSSPRRQQQPTGAGTAARAVTAAQATGRRATGPASRATASRATSPAPTGPGQGQGQGYDNQPTQTFNYQGRGAAYQGNGDPRGASGYDGYNGDPRGYQDGRGQGNMRRYEDPQRYDDQRYQRAGAGAWWPGIPGEPSPDAAAGPQGAVPPHSQVLPPPHRPHRQRRGRALPRLRDVLRRPGGLQEQRPGRVGEPRGMGQGPLPRPGRDVRRVAVLQPAAEGRQAVVLARRAQRRGGQPGQAGEGQGQERVRARHPGHAEVPRGLVDRRAKASGAWWRRSTASRRS